MKRTIKQKMERKRKRLKMNNYLHYHSMLLVFHCLLLSGSCFAGSSSRSRRRSTSKVGLLQYHYNRCPRSSYTCYCVFSERGGGVPSDDENDELANSSNNDEQSKSNITTEQTSSPSKPMRTLGKLQAMLDETDNATKSTSSTTSTLPDTTLDDQPTEEMTASANFWTSKDRSIDKRKQIEPIGRQPQAWKQQELQSRIQQQQRKYTLTQEANTVDNIDADDTDGVAEDGLEYTLPILPVYLSDGEPPEFDPPSQTSRIPPPTSFPYKNYDADDAFHSVNEDSLLTNNEGTGTITTGSASGSSHYGTTGDAELTACTSTHRAIPLLQQQEQYQKWQQQYTPTPYHHQNIPVHPNHPMYPFYASQYAAAWAAKKRQPPPLNKKNNKFRQASPQSPYNSALISTSGLKHNGIYNNQPGATTATTYFTRPTTAAAGNNDIEAPRQQKNGVVVKPTDTTSMTTTLSSNNNFQNEHYQKVLMTTSLAEAGTKLSFDSLQKLVFSFLGVTILSYCAVSPRTAQAVLYNMKFKENLQIVALVAIVPILFVLLVVFDAKENDINTVVSTFYNAFTMGYFLSFIVELILTTMIRLAVFRIWEPQAFDLDVPLPLLPWVLRENNYRPRRITLFVADLCTSCVASAFVEEYIKLKVMQWSVMLPKNFDVAMQSNSSRNTASSGKREGAMSRRRKREMEPISSSSNILQRNTNNEQQQQPISVTTINSYVTHMLASSIGLKLADSIRRALMYTKPADAHKGFYATCRGIFPIHELCGTLTALQLAKRDVLGIYMPLWKIMLPATFIHGIANFRGMKPVFKWNSPTPWSEMQMSPWNAVDDSTFFQIVQKGFSKLMWFTILGRVLIYCIKNYYMVTRQAVMRAIAGNSRAADDEIEAAELPI